MEGQLHKVLTVTSATVRVRDRLRMGDQEFQVSNLFSLAGHRKLVILEGADPVTLDLVTPVLARRPGTREEIAPGHEAALADRRAALVRLQARRGDELRT